MLWDTAYPENNIGFFLVDIIPSPIAQPWMCLENCQKIAANMSGVEIISGYYVLKHTSLHIFQFVKHYILKIKERLIDITPLFDKKEICFVHHDSSVSNFFTRSLDIDKYNIQENKLMYYVYCYIDSDSKIPIYVGKGTQSRAVFHINHCKANIENKDKNNRFYSKIKQMVKEGKEPEIIFLAQNIQDESIAYDIEQNFIKQYGRQGYDEGGVLLNICEGNIPPNHKGRSYKDIYGDKWRDQIKKRTEAQLARGGYGPKKHSLTTKAKIVQSHRLRNDNSRVTIEQYDELILKYIAKYGYKINYNILKYWLQFNNFPKTFTPYKLRGTNLLEYYVKTHNMQIYRDSMLWFYNPQNMEQQRICKWFYDNDIIKTKDNFIPGRGQITSNNIKGFKF